MRRPALDEAGLTELARSLGRVVGRGDIVLLHGGLGAGKTTFTRALAEGLAVTEPDRVCSPTFNLCLVHEGPTPLVHVDLYRLGEGDGSTVAAAAFEALGVHELEALATPGGWVAPDGAVLVVEWPEYWPHAPTDVLHVELHRSGPSRRDLVARGGGERARQTLARWVARGA